MFGYSLFRLSLFIALAIIACTLPVIYLFSGLSAG